MSKHLTKAIDELQHTVSRLERRLKDCQNEKQLYHRMLELVVQDMNIEADNVDAYIDHIRQRVIAGE